MRPDRECDDCGEPIPKHKRQCVKCGGLPAPERIPDRKPGCWDVSLEAAHSYQLHKTIKSGSWANTKGRDPLKKNADELNRIVQDFGGLKFSVRRPKCGPSISIGALDYFLFRCDVYERYQRSEPARLLAIRVILWAHGRDQEYCQNFLDITREERLFLDREIRRHFKFPARALKGQAFVLPEIVDRLMPQRRCKRGWAKDVIRRWQHGHYKHDQLLSFQVDGALSRREGVIYEGETT